jgi:hypothetical protein
VQPELLWAIERERLQVPDLPPSLDEVIALLLYWAVYGEEGRFCLAEAVIREPMLREHLPLSSENQMELQLRMS